MANEFSMLDGLVALRILCGELEANRNHIWGVVINAVTLMFQLFINMSICIQEDNKRFNS